MSFRVNVERLVLDIWFSGFGLLGNLERLGALSLRFSVGWKVRIRFLGIATDNMLSSNVISASGRTCGVITPLFFDFKL